MEWIVVGTFWFWMAWVAISLVVVWGLESDSGFFTTSSFIIGCGILWMLTGFHRPDFQWFGEHWPSLIGSVVSYVFLGACWGVLKWLFFLHNMADLVQADESANRINWKRDISDGNAPLSFSEWIVKKYTPKAADHRDDIIMWMCWWPWSAFWTLLNDPIKRLYRFIYQNMVTVYNRMATSIFTSRFKGVQ